VEQRRSDKHGRLIDEQLEHETSSLTHGAPIDARSREGRQQEELEEGLTDRVGPDGGTPAGTTPADIDLRSEMARTLRPSTFPAGRRELLAVAAAEYAPDIVLDLLQRLPGDRRFDDVEQVFEFVGGHGEARRDGAGPGDASGGR
jgi:hypothetical protein